jgi:hypothetical protein
MVLMETSKIRHGAFLLLRIDVSRIGEFHEGRVT